MDIKENLIIVDGRIKMRDGSSLRAYLKKWQEDFPELVPDGAAINVIPHRELISLADDAALARGWGA